VLQCIAVGCSVVYGGVLQCAVCDLLVGCNRDDMDGRRAPQYVVIYCGIVCRSVLQCSVLQCFAVQCVAACCNVLHATYLCDVAATIRAAPGRRSMLQCVAV